jgi:hypothetical protein
MQAAYRDWEQLSAGKDSAKRRKKKPRQSLKARTWTQALLAMAGPLLT